MVLMKACPLKLTVHCSRRLSLRSGVEGDKLRQVDTHNLGGNTDYDYIDLDQLDIPQGHDMELDNGAMSGPYSTIMDPDIAERNPTETTTSSTDRREPRVTDEIPDDVVMEKMDGYGENGNDTQI